MTAENYHAFFLQFSLPLILEKNDLFNSRFSLLKMKNIGMKELESWQLWLFPLLLNNDKLYENVLIQSEVILKHMHKHACPRAHVSRTEAELLKTEKPKDTYLPRNLSPSIRYTIHLDNFILTEL